MVALGKYRHYKGAVYEVIANATHSETLEPMVVYKDNRMSGRTWVRPEEEWRKPVGNVGDRIIPRFERIDS